MIVISGVQMTKTCHNAEIKPLSCAEAGRQARHRDGPDDRDSLQPFFSLPACTTTCRQMELYSSDPNDLLQNLKSGFLFLGLAVEPQWWKKCS